ncbi:MAG: nuclear transport factor 2 family protein [Actinobacteria bacterium]|nr:nuclear transport factor 2 family protein [Actinomycetota bacterium]
MDKSDFEQWADRYVVAWNTNQPDDIGRLFSTDALYLTGPFDEPWRGRRQIVEQWIERKDEPGNTEFDFDVIATEGDLGVVQGAAFYKEPPIEYSNIWVIRLNQEGQATYYAEWWVEKK